MVAHLGTLYTPPVTKRPSPSGSSLSCRSPNTLGLGVGTLTLLAERIVVLKTDVKLWEGHWGSSALHPAFPLPGKERGARDQTEAAAGGACGASWAAGGGGGAWLLGRQARALSGFRGLVICSVF